MAEENKHHLFGFLHHKKEEEQPAEAVVYSDTTYGADGFGGDYSETKTAVLAEEPEKDYAKEEREHKHKEHAGELGTLAAGAFALHEKHKAKKDPDMPTSTR